MVVPGSFQVKLYYDLRPGHDVVLAAWDLTEVDLSVLRAHSVQ
jgi:hypothetical protein